MRPIVAAFLLTLAVRPLTAQSVTVPPANDAARRVEQLVEVSRLDELRWPDFTDYRKHLRNFYAPRGYDVAWTRDAKPTPQALAVIALFKAADVKGINAVDYDAPRWDERLRALNSSAESLARFDLALSASVMRYISDLHIGRINPHNLRFELDIESKKYYLPRLLDEIRGSADPAAILADVEPHFEEYHRLQEALAKYRRLADDPENDVALPETKTRPGEKYAALPQLARFLRQVGDLPANAKVDKSVYSGAIVEAMKRFQSRHGLEPDGVLSARTFHALNVPLSLRVRQILLALERWRWMPAEFERAPIVVNVPEFILHAWSDDMKHETTMRVVVGQAYSHQTPIFEAAMRYVVFRPYWNVPPSIQQKELVPKVAKDPGYLARNGYEVVTADDKPLAIARVDAATLARLRSGALEIRQKPGPSNALGLVKFMFPNSNNVYLHSTPSQLLFSKSRRDFSHGCIRVEDPARLAAWVLRDQPQWTPERIKAAMNGKDPSQANLTKPIPIVILYSTAAVTQEGLVQFFDDIYGHDETLENALAAGYPYPA